MKKIIPESVVVANHRDHNLLKAIADEISVRVGGHAALAEKFSAMLRQCIDDVIMTPKTGRRSYDELEKTEKTYIGTRVEIELRNMMNVPKGKLDTVILGHDVDIKFTSASDWMIPGEAIDNPCILVAADEERALCYLGLVVARPEYLRGSTNQDKKGSLKASEFRNILWLLINQPYKPNFWRTVPTDVIDRIFAGKSGNARAKTLFRELQNRPIDREVIEAVGQQKDFMRRIRADKQSKRKGTRDHLAEEGILLLSGDYDAPLIEALRLPFCSGSEFVSYRPVTQAEVNLARLHGVSISWQPE